MSSADTQLLISPKPSGANDKSNNSNNEQSRSVFETMSDVVLFPGEKKNNHDCSSTKDNSISDFSVSFSDDQTGVAGFFTSEVPSYPAITEEGFYTEGLFSNNQRDPSNSTQGTNEIEGIQDFDGLDTNITGMQLKQTDSQIKLRKHSILDALLDFDVFHKRKPSLALNDLVLSMQDDTNSNISLLHSTQNKNQSAAGNLNNANLITCGITGNDNHQNQMVRNGSNNNLQQHVFELQGTPPPQKTLAAPRVNHNPTRNHFNLLDGNFTSTNILQQMSYTNPYPVLRHTKRIQLEDFDSLMLRNNNKASGIKVNLAPNLNHSPILNPNPQHSPNLIEANNLNMLDMVDLNTQLHQQQQTLMDPNVINRNVNMQGVYSNTVNIANPAFSLNFQPQPQPQHQQLNNLNSTGGWRPNNTLHMNHSMFNNQHDNYKNYQYLHHKFEKRNLHNKLEKRRREDLNLNFVNLQECLPQCYDKKMPKIHVLTEAIRHLQGLNIRMQNLNKTKADLLELNTKLKETVAKLKI